MIRMRRRRPPCGFYFMMQQGYLFSLLLKDRLDRSYLASLSHPARFPVEGKVGGGRNESAARR
ncbi:MAG: hypothetical protein JXR73_04585 [Candidatus Omnitrophica bacterium]|nr:hypothetical protein [Candidatus Omnitrophota bacterium]